MTNNNSYPGGNHGSDPTKTERTLQWLDADRTGQFNDSLKNDWESGPDGQNKVIEDVRSLMVDATLGNKDIPLPNAESVFDLSLRNIKVLVENANPDTFEMLQGRDYLGQVLSLAGGVFNESIHSDIVPGIGLDTPRQLSKQDLVKLINRIQTSANRHEAMFRGSEMPDSFMIQFADVHASILKLMKERYETNRDATFARNSNYILGNLAGMMPQVKDIARADRRYANIEDRPMRELVDPPEQPPVLKLAEQSTVQAQEDDISMALPRDLARAFTDYPDGLLIPRTDGSATMMQITAERVLRRKDPNTGKIIDQVVPNGYAIAIGSQGERKIFKLSDVANPNSQQELALRARAVEGAKKALDGAYEDGGIKAYQESLARLPEDQQRAVFMFVSEKNRYDDIVAKDPDNYRMIEQVMGLMMDRRSKLTPDAIKVAESHPNFNKKK